MSKIDSSITEVLYSHPFSLIASVTSLSCIFILSDVFIETKQYVIILDKDDVKERFQIPNINDILEILNMAFQWVKFYSIPAGFCNCTCSTSAIQTLTLALNLITCSVHTGDILLFFQNSIYNTSPDLKYSSQFTTY